MFVTNLMDAQNISVKPYAPRNYSAQPRALVIPIQYTLSGCRIWDATSRSLILPSIFSSRRCYCVCDVYSTVRISIGVRCKKNAIINNNNNKRLCIIKTITRTSGLTFSGTAADLFDSQNNTVGDKY